MSIAAIQPRYEFDEADVAMGRVKPADMMVAKEIAEILFRAYPAHRWRVRVQASGDYATIHNDALSQNYGYLIHLPKAEGDRIGLRAKIIQAGGEILERFAIDRGPAQDWSYEKALPNARLHGRRVRFNGTGKPQLYLPEA